MGKYQEEKKTPIIMLSGKTSPLDEVKGVLAGASTYLTKPVKHEQFQQTLKRVAKWLSVFATNPASESRIRRIGYWNNLRLAKSSGHKKSLILDEAFDVSAWH